MGTDTLQITVYIVVLIVLAFPMGSYMARVFTGERTFMDPVVRPLEKVIYRWCGVDAREEMNWKRYAMALLVFNFLGIMLVLLIQLIQGFLPLNPQGFKGVPFWLALNTAVSFVTNTNWQAYAGESTMSYLTQMAALAVQNFISAATGMAVAVALIRGLARKRAASIGNFWVDMTRSILWILLPISLVLALMLVSQGVIQNLHPYQTVTTLEGVKQTLAQGPIASQEAIKELGTNGGGFLNVNSAHPYENPTPLTNFLEMLAILIIPAALPLTFGRMVGNHKQGIAVLAAMILLFIISVGVIYSSEAAGNPLVARLGVAAPTVMEGKEVRFGVADTSLFAAVTTAASCGAVNGMHDSLTPLGGMMPLLQILLGEVVLGGVGSGLYGMLIFVIITVFIIGLMVGRTPEYLGKKIQSQEIKMAIFSILVLALGILAGTALAVILPMGRASILNPGPHGFSEVFYAFTSATGNNGSAFAGLNANTAFYNISLALAMLMGRFGVILPVLAIAGSMAKKQPVPAGPGTFDTTTWWFPGLLAVIVLIVGALTFFPALALGPIVEHLIMIS